MDELSKISRRESLQLLHTDQNQTIPNPTWIQNSTNCIVFYVTKKTFNIVYIWIPRICIDSSQEQEGIDNDTSYIPVLAWSTIHFCLTLNTKNGLKSQQIDYVQTFQQVDLHEDEHIYIEIPQCFYIYVSNDTKYYALKLNENAYGLKWASHNWCVKLITGLKIRKFKQIVNNLCLFI